MAKTMVLGKLSSRTPLAWTMERYLDRRSWFYVRGEGRRESDKARAMGGIYRSLGLVYEPVHAGWQEDNGRF